MTVDRYYWNIYYRVGVTTQEVEHRAHDEKQAMAIILHAIVTGATKLHMYKHPGVYIK